jgi:hypothetical protein
MPSFPWLYDQVTVTVEEKDGKLVFKDDAALRKIFTFKEGKEILILPNIDGLAFARERDALPVLGIDLLPNPPKTKAITIVLPTREAEGMARYVRAATGFCQPVLHTGIRGLDRGGQGGLYAALRRLPWGKGGRQRSGGDIYESAAARLPGRDIQVSRHALRRPSDGR